MGFREIFRAMAADEKTAAEVLSRQELASLYSQAAELSAGSDLSALDGIESRIKGVKQTVLGRQANAQILTEQILPGLLQQLHELRIDEPPVSYLERVVAQFTENQETPTQAEPKKEGRVYEHDTRMQDLTQVQVESLRVVLRLTDNPRNGVTMRDVVQEIAPDLAEEDLAGGLNRIFGSSTGAIYKIKSILAKKGEVIFPVDETSLDEMEINQNTREVLLRASQIPAYAGMDIDQVIDYCRSFKRKGVDLLAEPLSLSSMLADEKAKLFLARRLVRSNLESARRFEITRLLGEDRLNGHELPLSESLKHNLSSAILRYLDEDGLDQEKDFESIEDREAQVLLGSVVRWFYANRTEGEPEELFQSLLEISKNS